MVCTDSTETLHAVIFCNNLSMYGDFRIFRHGQEKRVDRIDFPPLAQEVETRTLYDKKFIRPLWRRENVADDAGSIARGRGRGRGRGKGRGLVHEAPKRSELIRAVAVVVHIAAQAAAAMHMLIGHTMTGKFFGSVTVDPVTACVSYERNRRCVIFSLCTQHPIKFVKSRGLPPSFIEVQRAQQVLLLLLLHSQPSTSAKCVTQLCATALSSSSLTHPLTRARNQLFIGSILHRSRHQLPHAARASATAPSTRLRMSPAPAHAPALAELSRAQLQRLLCVSSLAQRLCTLLLHGSPRSRRLDPRDVVAGWLMSDAVAQWLLQRFWPVVYSWSSIGMQFVFTGVEDSFAVVGDDDDAAADAAAAADADAAADAAADADADVDDDDSVIDIDDAHLSSSAAGN
jgi:hypothetical protein